MARVSSAEKPLAMRFINVASRAPLEKAVIASSICAAVRFTSGGSAEPDAPWQPEHEVAPAGAFNKALAPCAEAGVASAKHSKRKCKKTCMTVRDRLRIMLNIQRERGGGSKAAALLHQALRRSVFLIGMLRTRLPVAA